MIKTIGNHKVTCASLDDQIVDQMIGGDKVDIFYCDPPWGDGASKMFATMNKKATGKEFVPLSYAKIMSRMVGLINSYVDGHVFIETGLKWEAETVEALSGSVHKIRVYRVLYNSGRKMNESVLIHGVTNPSIVEMQFDPSGMTGGVAVPTKCIESVATKGGIVLDPCCGMGFTAKAAVHNQMRFFGNEFNSARLQKTIDFLQK